MSYQPANGDHVTVTRIHADGRTGTCTGAIYFTGAAGAFTPDTGFTIDGCGSHASATDMRFHDVDQTVTPNDQADA